MKIMIKLSKMKQPRLSGRTLAAEFIKQELEALSESSKVTEINFDLSDIKSVNQSFFNEILQTTYQNFPDALIYPSNAENSELIVKFNQELERIKVISKQQSKTTF